ncbi:hypothetical protein M569_14307 [Genlisea aurea]|uniref:RING-type domain-containing protein n=1 Tax=Genlisea aurea TaxID=192259 RepID=S8C7Y3_9LAMI|nr:hypothetical protein M569_14307 [Genlisea aurea]
MENREIVLIIIPLLLFTAESIEYSFCTQNSCAAGIGPDVAFPFRLTGRSADRCGYPGFELQCDSKNQTVLRLPESGDFVVDRIDYAAQTMYINDPNSCLPARLLNFSLRNTPFVGTYTRNFTFYNCSASYANFTSTNFTPVSCLSGENYTVLAVNRISPAAVDVPAVCRPFATIPVPLQWTMMSQSSSWLPGDLREDLEIGWNAPSCGECVTQGGVCGFKSGSGLDVGCVRASPPGLPRSAKYGIIVGAGIPSLVCIVGLACYIFGMVGSFRRRRQPSAAIPTSDHHQTTGAVATCGLDSRTIESYPTTVLGESRRVPKSSDGSCPICLSEYQPKEKVRSLPECSHSFHAGCIDEWLKLNGTCPLCRNSLEASSSSSPSEMPPPP